MTWTFAVQASATVSADPPRVELNWPTDPFPIVNYSVHRKAIGASVWGEPIATLPGEATRFTDESVELGKTYEYQLVKNAEKYTGYGYIAVGINATLVDVRGRAVLVVDDTLAGPLAGEIARFQNDLAGDGWTVVRHDVSRSSSPAEVKALIKAAYNADPGGTQAAILLGRIPIVRSGTLNVDGHGARPMPADVFYGDMDGVWTDANEDGIYDQNLIPSSLELQVGRIDFADLPGKYSPVAYANDIELTRRYLEKDHAFRQARVRPPQRAIIGGLNDANGQAYSAAAFRNFSAIVGNNNIVIAPTEISTPPAERWLGRLVAGEYLWAYGAGAGSDFTIGSLGEHGIYNDLWASDLVEKKAKATFYLMFGSWFSDWTKPDNILRTALTAPDRGLASAWMGRPHHFYHHMGIGETIGYGMRVTQNNEGLYKNQVQRQLRGVHIALMGDPTIRLHAVAPPRNATISTAGGNVALSWQPSEDTVFGYHVYRATNSNGPYTRLTTDLVGENRYVDGSPVSGTAIYQVRAVTLAVGASGSFYTASQGAFASTDQSGLASEVTIPSASSSSEPGDLVWVEDALPPGAQGYADRDGWNWVSTPGSYSGTLSHQAENAAGKHHHFFVGAAPLSLQSRDILYAYVYLDPASPPRQIMLTWLADNWEHRAYWGENLLTDEGVDGTASRIRLGGLPPTGQWIRLEIPVGAVGLENRQITGMGFTLFDGRVSWDRAGRTRQQ
ncbi:MAG: fibronectin type III domain-containing protein [Verrucomicrobiota bacterium]